MFVLPDLPNPDATALVHVADALGAAMQRYGGLLHELGVDDKGLVAVLLFGLRQTHEDQGQRALRAAVAVQTALAGAGIRASIGVASGRVYCGVVGDARRSELAVVGDPMNHAARLMQAAGGGLLCDPATAAEASARRAFAFAPVPGLALKGVPADWIAQRPSPRDGAAAPADPTTRGPTPAPLGRDAEWARLAIVLDVVRRPEQGAAALLEGDAGIGKSALLAAAVSEAGRLGAALLRVQGQALEQVSPYHAWRGATAQLLGVDLAADRSVQMTRLQMALAADADAATLGPLLAAVLPHAPPPTAAVEALDAQARAERLRELLLSMVARAAAAVPLVVVVEDAHWLDSASWALLHAMATRKLPLVVLMSSRPLEAEARAALVHWLEASGAQALALGPLSRQACGELMRRKLGVRALSEGVESLVHGRAAGHPFFTEELVLALRDAGVLQVENGLCSLSASGGDLGSAHVVPDSLARALTVRIDSISEARRLALKVASVLGRDVELAELEAVYPVDRERRHLRDHLQALVGHELLVPAGPDRYRFKHAITRDVAYGLLPFALRRDLHRALAEHIGRDPLRAAAPQSTALLAHHWSHAEVPDKALEACEAAGMQALERFANREAVHFLRETLRWHEALGRTAPAERVARWYSSLGLAHRLLGELDAARQALEAALGQLGAVVPARTPAARARTAWALLQFAFTKPRVGSAGEAPNAANTAVEAYAQLAFLAHYANDVEGMVSCSVLAGRVAQRAAPAREVAALHGSLAHTASFLKFKGAMRRHVQATYLVAERVGTPLVVGTAYQFTGHLAAGQGDFTTFQADMQRAHAAYAELGRCRPLEEALTNLSCLAVHRGELDRAYELAFELERSGHARDDRQSASWGAYGQGCARFVQARLAQALERLGEAGSLATDKLTEINIVGVRALALLRDGQADAALAEALRGLELAERAPSTSYFSLLPYGFAMETLVRLAVEAGQPEARTQAGAGAARMLKVFGQYTRLFPVARVQLAIWTGAVAELAGRGADARRAWRRAAQAATCSQVPLDVPMAQRWLARGLAGDERTAALTRAAEGYAALGYRFEADEARSAAVAASGASTPPVATKDSDERMAT